MTWLPSSQPSDLMFKHCWKIFKPLWQSSNCIIWDPHHSLKRDVTPVQWACRTRSLSKQTKHFQPAQCWLFVVFVSIDVTGWLQKQFKTYIQLHTLHYKSQFPKPEKYFNVSPHLQYICTIPNRPSGSTGLSQEEADGKEFVPQKETRPTLKCHKNTNIHRKII